MKKRVVINCQDCIKNIQNPNSGISVDDLDYDVEQIPETFEELKELCKGIIGISFGRLGETKETEYITLDNKIYFGIDGTIDFGFDNLAYTITPAQMWEIIKSLTKQEDK